MQEANVGEKDLNELDKTIAKAIKTARPYESDIQVNIQKAQNHNA